jgi:tetratricopeptide (TPR) repeat protein
MTVRLVVAFTLFTTVLFSQSKEDVILNNQAVALMDEGKYQEALPYLDKLSARDTANYIYRYNRAVTLFNLKQFHNAIAEYQYLHSLIPEQSEYVFQLGNAYEHLDSSNVAISYYTKAIEMDRDHFIYFFKRGTLYLKQEKYPEAVADFSASIEINPKHHNSFHNRGIALYKLGNRTQACEDWCQAVQLGNTFSKSHLSEFCNQDGPCISTK